MNMTQEEIYKHLKENIHSHEIETVDNKIIGKRLYKSDSFRNFKITFLKNKEEVTITTYRGRTLKYDNTEDLFSLMGAFTQLGIEK